MAREVIERMIDDLDQSDADESVRFGLDNRTYTIDLNEKNAEEFRALMAPYVSVAALDGNYGRRPVSEGAPRRRRTGERAAALSERRLQLESVRAWARDAGFEVADRGRISRQVWRAYEEAGSPSAF